MRRAWRRQRSAGVRFLQLQSLNHALLAFQHYLRILSKRKTYVSLFDLIVIEGFKALELIHDVVDCLDCYSVVFAVGSLLKLPHLILERDCIFSEIIVSESRNIDFQINIAH